METLLAGGRRHGTQQAWDENSEFSKLRLAGIGVEWLGMGVQLA